jgi:Uma2 family endonuclease
VEPVNVGEPGVQTRKLTRLEYERMVEAEILGPEDRVELLGGTMIVKEPQYSPHATAIQLAARALRRIFADRWDVRVQLPLALADDSQPEPDVWVVPGDPRDYRDRHPETAVLVVEVAPSRVAFDRNYKGSLYARAGIADYWVVDLPARRLEIHREPVRDASAPFGWRYGRTAALGGDQRVAPLAMASAEIAVADLLP